MTLGFSQEIKGVKNFFVAKIWTGLKSSEMFPVKTLTGYAYTYKFKFGNWPEWSKDKFKPKLHTIRAGERWRAGMDIHMVINNRTKNRFQFAPTIKCKSVQHIEINWAMGWPLVRVFSDAVTYKIIIGKDLQKLAINDGFHSVDDFFAYFNKDFTGQLIHWTDLKY